MAKLKGPLFSLGATQQIGKALVYFPWKGLNCVREYVIPANPKTTAQTTQRGYLASAVNLVHIAQARAPNPFDEADVMAYALWASVVKPATTWFNQAVKNCVDQLRLLRTPIIWINGSLVPAAGQLTLYITDLVRIGVVPTNGDIFYGTSKTALVNKQSATPAQIQAGVAIAGLTAGVKYYFQYRPDAPAGVIGSNSGIYYGVPT